MLQFMGVYQFPVPGAVLLLACCVPGVVLSGVVLFGVVYYSRRSNRAVETGADETATDPLLHGRGVSHDDFAGIYPG